MLKRERVGCGKQHNYSSLVKALVPEFAVKDLPLGRTHYITLIIAYHIQGVSKFHLQALRTCSGDQDD